MTESLEAVLIEYHPIGNESAAVICRLIAERSGQTFLLDGQSTHLISVDSHRSDLFRLMSPITVEAEHVAVVIGPEYAATLIAISRAAAIESASLALLGTLPVMSYGVRVFVGNQVSCDYLVREFGTMLVRAFDQEMRASRHDGPFALMLWSLIDAGGTVRGIERLLRGVYLYGRLNLSEELQRLVADAAAFDELASFDEYYEAYVDSITSQKVPHAENQSDDWLALNAKVDLLYKRLNAVEASTRSEHANILIAVDVQNDPRASLPWGFAIPRLASLAWKRGMLDERSVPRALRNVDIDSEIADD